MLDQLSNRLQKVMKFLRGEGKITERNMTEALKMLRMADENIYLRASSINLFNGVVGLTFSCDGSHYMRYDEFLEKSLSFWLGATA